MFYVTLYFFFSSKRQKKIAKWKQYQSKTNHTISNCISVVVNYVFSVYLRTQYKKSSPQKFATKTFVTLYMCNKSNYFDVKNLRIQLNARKQNLKDKTFKPVKFRPPYCRWFLSQTISGLCTFGFFFLFFFFHFHFPLGHISLVLTLASSYERGPLRLKKE